MPRACVRLLEPGAPSFYSQTPAAFTVTLHPTAISPRAWELQL